VFTINVLPIVPDPKDPKKFLSRKNLLEGNDKPFPLDRLMAFGTAVTCYIPVERRRGGKEPGQRRSFNGALMGYEEGMPAYRVWDLLERIIKLVSYVFTICHEGFYPMRDKAHWPEEWTQCPHVFSPVYDGVLSMGEWWKFGFDDEDSAVVLAQAPNLLLDIPEDPEKEEKRFIPSEVDQKSFSPPPLPAASAPAAAADSRTLSGSQSVSEGQGQLIIHPSVFSRPATQIPAEIPALKAPTALPPSHRLREFWQEKIIPPAPISAPAPIVAPAPLLRRSERAWNPTGKALENIASFSLAPPEEKFPLAKFAQSEAAPDVFSPVDKPISIPPPKTFKEAMLSPWRKQYFDAAQTEYDGHLKSQTWKLVPRSEIPKGKNLLRGKWVFADKRDEAGKILKFKARFVAMGFTQKYGEDYTETFAGVVIGKTFRIMLSILNSSSEHSMEHWDVHMAFTQAELEEELFMEQPEGFQIDPQKFCCKLLKSIYGLKQSAYKNQQRCLSW
jgi:hypothetical protein